MNSIETELKEFQILTIYHSLCRYRIYQRFRNS
jgi:hypothetical protein